jgi:hypothetical protein
MSLERAISRCYAPNGVKWAVNPEVLLRALSALKVNVAHPPKDPVKISCSSLKTHCTRLCRKTSNAQLHLSVFCFVHGHVGCINSPLDLPGSV